MGIRRILSFLSNHANICGIQKTNLIKLPKTIKTHSQDKPIIIAVDFNQILFNHIYTYNKYNLLDDLHVYLEKKFTQMINKFAKLNIKLIFVMDGKPSAHKKFTISKRKERIDRYTTIYNEQVTDDEITPKMKCKTTHITYDDCNHMEQYFAKNKIPFIHHDDYEADVICKWLVEYEYADYALSNDTDLLAYGCKHILMDLQYADNTVTYINYQTVINSINMTPEKFLDLCISCGTDYNSRFTNTSIVYKLFQIQTTTDEKSSPEFKYQNLQHIIAELDNIKIQYPEILGKDIKDIKAPTYLDYQLVYSIFQIKFKKDEIHKFLSMKHIYSEQKLLDSTKQYPER